jgi:F-type H+-transporting ATPase subunit delta
MNVDAHAVRVYAEALFAAAKDAGTVATLEEQTRILQEVFTAVPRLRTLLEVPHVSTDEKVAMARKVLDDRFDATLRNFVLLLLKKHRIEILDPSLREFRRLAEKEQGIMHGTVTSAALLDEELKQQVRTALENHTGFKLTLEYKVDSALLGGVIFRAGDILIDNSLRSQVRRLRRNLLAARMN